VDPLDTIAAARTKLTRTLWYFTSPVMALRPFPLKGLGTFGVDAESRMAFDPLCAAEWGVEACSTIVFHEALHINGDHFGRQGNREHELWNWACDISINQIIRDAGFGWPAKFKPLMPELFGLAPNLSAEEYYDLLTQNEKARKACNDHAQKQAALLPGGGQQSGQQGGQLGKDAPQSGNGKAAPGGGGKLTTFPGCGGADGTGGGSPQGWEERAKELSDGIEGQDPADAKLMRRSTAEKIANAIAAAKAKGGKGQGDIPAGLQVWAQTMLQPPTVRWQSVLASDVRSAIASKSGADDYTRARISRRYWGLARLSARAPVMPALRSPKPEVVIVVDTSGSMVEGDNPPVLIAMSEAIGVVKAIGAPLRVMAVDAAVQAVARVVSAKDIERLNAGGGGTNMVVGITEADKSRPDVIVLLTDGQTPWPAPNAMPHAKLVVAVLGNSKVPDHIRKVVRIPMKETT
jgi:predicted metal-dependent peptidase